MTTFRPLSVPYSERSLARALGAQWSAPARRWICTATRFKSSRFKRWRDTSRWQRVQIFPDMTPQGIAAAKEHNCSWDSEKKEWFIQFTGAETLTPWHLERLVPPPEHVQTQSTCKSSCHSPKITWRESSVQSAHPEGGSGGRGGWRGLQPTARGIATPRSTRASHFGAGTAKKIGVRRLFTFLPVKQSARRRKPTDAAGTLTQSRGMCTSPRTRSPNGTERVNHLLPHTHYGLATRNAAPPRRQVLGGMQRTRRGFTLAAGRRLRGCSSASLRDA
jgi:hypothetical protein